MDTKENDWLLNRVSNPSFSIDDFKAVGLDATNTSLEDADVYKNIPQIQDSPVFQTDGKFDDVKFDNAYKFMAESYNQLANDAYQEDVLKQATFHRDNIFAPEEQRRKGPDIYLSREANPLRQKRGVRRLNLLESPTMSADEVAQTQKVWDGTTKKWHDSPNDSFWSDFWDTRVMAQWDNDGDHIDPVTKEKTKHKKGDLKLNENGTYYYENLNRRDVYGRQVLSKLNTLTTDGSAINKYDFFDSDGLDKSLGGSLMRNAVTIIPMLIPGVNSWYIGSRIALETSKMFSTLGKVFTGSDNKFLSSVEGFAKSLEPTTSEYSQGNAWSMENFINLAGDVFKQLYEQRWLFKYAPAAFKGGKVMDETAQAEKQAEFAKQFQTLDQYTKLTPKQLADFTKVRSELQAVNAVKAQKALEDYMEGYNKIGEIMSKVYMTGITVEDSYGEAKQQGASDLEAALLTLGYSVGEYGIINSRLGEWILPELRMDKEQMRQVVRSLTEGSRETLNNASKVQKVEYAKKLFKLGKDIFQANYSVGKAGLKATVANALGEGFEEVSEELLYDFSKSMTNLGMWLAGSDTPPLQAWNNMVDRYGMSFVGGFVGGTMFDMTNNLRAARHFKEMDKNDAYQQIVYLARNNKMNEFLKVVDGMDVGNKYLSATKMTEGIDGKKIWAQGTSEDNQDIAAKNEIKRVTQFVTDTLAAHGASISDNSFLDIQTLSDLRFSALKNSSVASRYLQDYNTLCSKIINVTNQLNEMGGTTDRMQNGGPTDEQLKKTGEDETTKSKRSGLESELKSLLEQKEGYLKGEMAPEFIYESLFEMSPAVSGAYMSPTFIQYAENKTGRKVTEIPQNELDDISAEYKGWKNSNMKDVIHLAASLHKSMAKVVAPLFQNHSAQYYETIPTNEVLQPIQEAINKSLIDINSSKSSEDLLFTVSSQLQNSYANTLVPLIQSMGSDSDKTQFDNFIRTPLTEENRHEKETGLLNLFNNFLVSNIEKITNPVIKQGFVHPEVKKSLLNTLYAAEYYFNNHIGPENELNGVKINNAITKINKLAHSNISELLDQFSLSTSDSNVKMSKLMDEIEIALRDTAGDIASFNLNNDKLNQVKEALSVIDMFKAQLLSARADNADLYNIYGMNSTINELDSEANLAEIPSNIADAMMQDIETLELKFKMFQNVIAANNAQKLSEQTRTATNKNIIVFNKLKKFITYIPDDWKDKTKLEGVLGGLTKLDEISNSKKLNLNSDELAQVEKEMIQLDDSIYDFFNANMDKVTDSELLSKIINQDNFNFLSPNEGILNSDSSDIDDNAFVWYLTARAAVKASDFYNEYRTIVNDKIAPIPTQELATYLGYASVLNGGMVDNFCNAVNASLKKYAQEHPDIDEYASKIKNTIPEFILDSEAAPRFSKVTFIEGIPGSGKTSGVFSNLIVLLKKYHSDVLKNVWIGHATEDSAKELRETLNIETAVINNKEQLMKRISSDWHESTSDTNGNIVIGEDETYIDDNNIVRSTFKVNEISNAPSLILIDEVSRYTTLDMDLINKFATKYGIPVITAGDFDQSRVVGKHTLMYKGQTLTNQVQLARNNFPRTPKLGVSMRSNNSQVNMNLNAIRAALPELRLGSPVDLLLHYYQDETGLYGTKVYDDQSYDESLIKTDLDLMVSTLLPGEKIGFIYYNPDSEVYNILANSTYSDKIDFRQGNSAQGLEGRYYIIDDSQSLGLDEYWGDLYTGISRAMQGSLVLHTHGFEYEAGNSNGLISIQDTSTSVNELSEDGIKTFSENRRNILNKLELDSKPTSLTKRNKDTTVPVVTVTPEVGLTSETVTTVGEDGDREEVIITNNGLPTEEEIRTKVQESNEDITPPPAPTVEVHNISGTESKAALNLLLYTFPTFESGTEFTQDGKLIVSEENSKRLDSYFGLNKLTGIPKSKEAYDKLIGNLRSIIFNTKDKGELLKKLQRLLHLGEDVYCTFAFKSSAQSFNNPAWARFRKDVNTESLNYMFSNDENSNTVKLKTLSIIIGEGTNDVLELPLAVMPNPLTVFKNDKFEAVKHEYDETVRRNPSMNTFERFNHLIDFIKSNPSIEGGQSLIDFLKVYMFNSNGVFFIDNPEWTLANALNAQGPSMTNRTKGMDYEQDTKLVYDGQWITLNELTKVPGLSVSKVKLSPKGVYTFNGKSVNFAKPGHPYILVSTDIAVKGSMLEEQYYKQLEDNTLEKKVKLVYVVPPKASIRDYFDNLLNIMSNNKNSVKRIGNDFTAYRILKILTAQPGFKESKEMNYNMTAYDGVMQIISNLNNADGDTKAQISILNESVDIQGLNKDITAKQALQNYLLNIVYPPGATNTDRIFQKDNLDSIEHILTQNKIPGIFYNIQYNKESADSVSIDAVYDEGVYSIDGNPFMVNGKIESPSFYGDVSPLLETINSKITKNANFGGSKDNTKYLNGNSRIGNVPEQTIDTVFNSFNIQVSPSIQSELKLEDIKNLPKNELLDKLKQLGHLVVPIGNLTYISKKSPDLDLSGAIISDISQVGLNIHKFTLSLDNSLYNAEFNTENNEVLLIKIQQESEGNPLSVFEAKSLKEVQLYQTVLSVINRPTFRKLGLVRGVENFNAEMNNIEITQKVVNKLKEESNEFDEGDQKMAMQTMIDFFQSKLDTKSQLNTSDNSCPIQIKIKF